MKCFYHHFDYGLILRKKLLLLIVLIYENKINKQKCWSPGYNQEVQNRFTLVLRL